MPVTIEQGDILRIDAKGQRLLHRFDDTKLYDYMGYLNCWPTCGTVRLTAGDRAYLDELKAVASAYGYSPESIDRLASHGFLPEEIEEFRNLIDSTISYDSYDEQILNIIMEEAAPFFQGQKSVDEVAGIIQSKVSIYISENL